MKRAYDADHQIDGVPMLMPDTDIEISYEDSDSDSSGFDETGYYHRQIIRYDRRTWRFRYAVLTREEFLYLRKLIKEKATFSFTFTDEGEEEAKTVEAYANPVSVAYQSKRSGLYKNFTLEIVEC